MVNRNLKGKKRRKARNHSITILYFTILVLILAIPISRTYTIAILSKSNITLEDLRNDIEEQENINESLKMEISELASLDTIQTIAAEQGLTYQNNNIKVVTNE